MKSRFDEIVNRRNTNSLKWDVKKDELPMWVADMDFKAAPELIDAFHERVDESVFGYNIVPNEWYESYIVWWNTRHHYTMEKEWLLFSTGVVPSISSIVRKMTTVGENICVLTPVYNIFFNSILNNGRHAVECPLLYQNGHYEIDWDSFEMILSDPQTTMLIFCNPHNPIGKIWDFETLKRIGNLCEKYNVLVLSDEIHCDIVSPGCEYIPYQSVSETCKNNSIMCISPTKCFNLAGIQTSCICVPNPVIRNKVNRGINTDEVAEGNSFAMLTPVVAFTKCGYWIDELNEYIQKNKEYVCEFIQNELSMLKIVPSNATYLMWIDCSKLTSNTDQLIDIIREKTGLVLSRGSQYGKTGESFIRLNVACPKNIIIDGLERFKKGIRFFTND